MRYIIINVLSALSVLCWLAPAATADIDAYDTIVATGPTQHARPLYTDLIVHTKALHTALTRACETEKTAKTPEVIAKFERAVIAWESVAHLRWGPASKDYRYGRMFFGADPAEYAWKKLVILLFTQNRTVLDIEVFRQQTTAIQGFTALEYILFPPTTLPDLGGYPCELARTIAENMYLTAKEIASGWQEGAPYIVNLNDPDPDHPFVQNELEAAMQFFKPLAGGMNYMIAADLKKPLQDNAKTARPKEVNYGRSGMSNAALLAKVKAFEDLYRYAGFAEVLAPKDYALHQKIMAGFARSVDLIATLDQPFEHAVTDKAGHKTLVALVTELEALWTLLVYDMAEQFDFVLGFNTFDGD